MASEVKTYPYILGLAKGNPQYEVPQTQAVKIAQSATAIGPKIKERLPAIYENSLIDTRQLAIRDLLGDCPDEERFFPKDNSFTMDVQQRLQRFEVEAIPLCSRVAQEAIDRAGIEKDKIGKIVVVSSTGFLGPGLDCALINTLKLPRTLDRTLVGFMGCAAAMNGFDVACDYVKSHDQLALLVCVELSSVHASFEDQMNNAILSAIFADGCAAAIIGSCKSDNLPKNKFIIHDSYSYLTEGTEDGITLDIKGNGITCTLSRDLPKYLFTHIDGYVGNFLARHEKEKAAVDFWAVHPGGRRILESVRDACGVDEELLADSYAVLKKYGNMLSPSVMFVLERMAERFEKEGPLEGKEFREGLAFSFSPGVGVDGLMLRYYM